MKKIFIALFLSGVLISGCSVKKAESSEKGEIPTASDVSASAEEATENKPVERVLEPAEGTYIYDKAKLLDAETIAACNDYTEWLYKNYLINAAVVTVDKLGERSPEEFASEAYNEIYAGKGSGLLLLINNDTNQDILLKTGSCKSNISEEAEKDAFYWSTKDIVAGDYKIMLDSKTSEIIAYSKEKMPDKLTEVLKKSVELSKKGDNEAAVRLAAELFKG